MAFVWQCFFLSKFQKGSLLHSIASQFSIKVFSAGCNESLPFGEKNARIERLENMYCQLEAGRREQLVSFYMEFINLLAVKE